MIGGIKQHTLYSSRLEWQKGTFRNLLLPGLDFQKNGKNGMLNLNM